MKLHVMLVVCSMVFGATGFLVGMETGEISLLTFILNNDKQITGYAKYNMEYFIDPKNFIHKRITDVVPLDEKDKNAIELGLDNAIKSEKIQQISYLLCGEKFMTFIEALKTEDIRKYQFYVRVEKVKALT